MKKIILGLVFCFLTVSCANTRYVYDPRTPSRYYQSFQPAVGGQPLAAKDILRTEFDTMSADSRSDKTAAIVVGTLIGAIILSGIIVPIVVLSD